MLNIIIPMAGRGSRFAEAGYEVPKPLIPINGKPMIHWVVKNIRPSQPHRFVFICLADHLATYPEIESTLRQECPECEIVLVTEVTEGAACTVLLAKELINNANPLMIANSDQLVELPIDDYLATAVDQIADGLIMTFWSDHPKWSYCRMDGPKVTEVVEKKVVSNEATVGIYNFAHGADFVRAAESMIAQKLRVNGEFYVAPAYNQLIAEGKTIVTNETGKEYDGMHGLGTPEDLDLFLKSKFFRAYCRTEE